VKTGRGVKQGCCLSLILFNLHGEDLTKAARQGSGDFKTGRQVMRTPEMCSDVVLPAKEETALHSMIARAGGGRRSGIEVNVKGLI
jgi:hypothetical protein